MATSENEHVRLAQRLTDMLCRLNEGQALDIKQLAVEHQVSTRTIQRDINQRLASALPMLDVNQYGHYVLPISYLGQLGFDDIRQFAILVGVADLFPDMDRQFLRRLLDPNAKHIYVSKGQFNESGQRLKRLFEQLEPAILKRYKITLYYKGSYHLVEPYKLINHRSCWYVAAVKEDQLKAYRLSFVKELLVHDDQQPFLHQPNILDQLAAEDSIWFGQDKYEAVLKISAEVAEHFRQRTLLPQQQTLTEMADGGLLVSVRYVDTTQILPLIRYWIPHIHVVDPKELHDELIQGLQGYCGFIS